MGVRSFVIEPQSLFVPALSEMLLNAGLEIVRISGAVDLKSILRVRPEMVFGDLDFVSDEPLDAISTLRSVLPEAIICVYTVNREDRWWQSCRRLGADAIFSKSAPSSDVVEALQKIMRRTQALG